MTAEAVLDEAIDFMINELEGVPTCAYEDDPNLEFWPAACGVGNIDMLEPRELKFAVKKLVECMGIGPHDGVAFSMPEMTENTKGRSASKRTGVALSLQEAKSGLLVCVRFAILPNQISTTNDPRRVIGAKSAVPEVTPGRVAYSAWLVAMTAGLEQRKLEPCLRQEVFEDLPELFRGCWEAAAEAVKLRYGAIY